MENYFNRKEDETSNSKFSGRWTIKEHQRFIEALQIFGKNWKKVEEYVGTRNGAQIRSHAQKFFLKLRPDGRSEPGDGEHTSEDFLDEAE